MADRDKQKYYWLKLDKDFFNEYKIRSLMSMKKGDVYVVILLQLMNESLNYDGVLRYSKNRAYTVPELASVLGRTAKLLEETIGVLKEKELIEVKEDGTIILDVNVGYETGSARRKRAYRNGQSWDNVPEMSQSDPLHCPLENRVIENRTEEDIQIREITERMLEMGYSPKLIEKARKILYRDGYPHTAEFYQKILNVLTDGEIFNKEGYIYQIVRNKA